MAEPEVVNGTRPTIAPACQVELLASVNLILEHGDQLMEELGPGGSKTILQDLACIRESAEKLAERLGMLFAASKTAPVEEPFSCRQSNPCLNGTLDVGRKFSPDLGQTTTILVVDDVEANREILARRLERQGYRIVMAEHGLEALERLQVDAFDLILLDIMMPVMDGYETLKRIKSNSVLRHIPVIVVSALTDMDSIIACIEAGAEDFLPKPFNPTLLKARIGAALEKKRLMEQERCLLEQNMRVEAALDRHHALTQAVAGIAHEINTPLGIANTGISIIENRFSLSKIQDMLGRDDESREWLEDILESMSLVKKNVIRAHKLIENFKKISVSQVLERKETVSLIAIINDAIELYKLSAEQAKLTFEMDDSGIASNPDWHGYPGYLIQILMNFFQNIERYAYPDGTGGKVKICLADEAGLHDQDSFVIKVFDYGAGIDADCIKKVFDPFFTTGRSRGGTGLGLSIVRNLVTMALKGTVDVVSAPGEGACFVVRIPKVIAKD